MTCSKVSYNVIFGCWSRRVYGDGFTLIQLSRDLLLWETIKVL